MSIEIVFAALIVTGSLIAIAVIAARRRSPGYRARRILKTIESDDYKRARAAELLAVIVEMSPAEARRRIAALPRRAVRAQSIEQIIVSAAAVPASDRRPASSG